MCASLNYVLRTPFNVDVYVILLDRVAPSDNFYFVVLIPWDVKINFSTLISLSNQMMHIGSIIHQEVEEGNFKFLAFNFVPRTDIIVCFQFILQPSVCISKNAVDDEVFAHLSHWKGLNWWLRKIGTSILFFFPGLSNIASNNALRLIEQVVFDNTHSFSFRQCSSLTYTDVVKQSTVLNCLEVFD